MVMDKIIELVKLLNETQGEYVFFYGLVFLGALSITSGAIVAILKLLTVRFKRK